MKVGLRLTICLVAAALSVAPRAAWAGDDETVPAASNSDPLEGMNRGIFWFNDKVDGYVLEPVATGWDTIAPDRVQQSVANFFSNLRFPVVAINNLLQGKILHTASDVGRFVVNTTIGFVGFFDPATGWGLEQHDEDFGQTLGYWGVPPGPYLVLPLLGPSNPRDATGLAADSFTAVYPMFVSFVYTMSARTVDVVNFRAQVLDDVREARAASLDYYVFVRNAYEQRRQRLVNDEMEIPAAEQEDLYYGDFDDGE